MAENMDEIPDTETDALIEAMAHAFLIRDILGPIVQRRDERRRIRLAVRESRAKKSASSLERRSA